MKKSYKDRILSAHHPDFSIVALNIYHYTISWSLGNHLPAMIKMRMQEDSLNGESSIEKNDY